MRYSVSPISAMATRFQGFEGRVNTVGSHTLLAVRTAVPACSIPLLQDRRKLSMLPRDFEVMDKPVTIMGVRECSLMGVPYGLWDIA